MNEWRGDADKIRAALRTPGLPVPEMTPEREAWLVSLGYELPEWADRQAHANAQARDERLLRRIA
ncbi:MAG: hypothetical protein ACRDPD_30075 [Streptosporangiaceae bacterium]